MNNVLLAAIANDLSLPIPANIGLLEVLIVVTFLLHIIFINFTIALVFKATILELIGIIKKDAKLDAMAQVCSYHASIHKSIAVVLGVGPLLIISVIYTQYFYPSTILIGKMWLSLIVILTVAFLLLYVYKFTWDKWQQKNKGLHAFIGILASAIFLFVPLIFIVNVTSMLYPDMWKGADGFFHSLFYYPQIWQRYFHFILASLAAGGFYLFVFFAFKRRKSTIEVHEQSLKKFGLKVGFWATLFQMVTGFILLFSFEKNIRLLYLGEDALLTSLLVASIILTIVLCALLHVAGERDNEKAFLMSIVTFVVILGVMGIMRHELRENYLQPYMDEHPRTTQASISNTK